MTRLFDRSNIMDVDSDTPDPVEDTESSTFVPPGNRILPLTTAPGSTMPEKLLVRVEYLRIFNAVKEYLDIGDRCAIVSGQPGIGKTWWI